MPENKTRFLIFVCGLLFTFSAAAQEKPAAEEEFFELIRREGIAKAIDTFDQARQSNPDTTLFREMALNGLGYEFLGADKREVALEIFKLNISAYPDASNTYDSLAEIYMLQNNIPLAITALAEVSCAVN